MKNKGFSKLTDWKDMKNKESQEKTWSPLIGVLVFFLHTAATVGEGVPIVTGFDSVTGNSTMLSPNPIMANLDGDGWVTGNTVWSINGDGTFFNETRVGFAWSQATGPLVFEISQQLYFDPNVHSPLAISDGGTVVGRNFFTGIGAFTNLPFVFTSSGGFRYLATGPGPTGPTQGNQPGALRAGDAVGVSADGAVIVGTIQEDGPFFDVPTRASKWSRMGLPQKPRFQLNFLPTSDVWSHAWDASADGAVIVGDTGPTRDTVAATRWIDGVQQPLAGVGTTSSAQFASEDGAAAIGTALVVGSEAIVHWDANGDATVATLPAGFSLNEINASNASATAVVGSVFVDGGGGGTFGQWAPFIWTLADGFVIIPEQGLEQEYDLSEAKDVSDDGNVVIGRFRSSNGTSGPPTLAFMWIRGIGVVLFDDLLTSSGFPPTRVSDARNLSGDGLKAFVAAGGLSGGPISTGWVVLQLQAP